MTEPVKPLNPLFSSGLTEKFKGWSINKINNSLIVRSHRSSDGMLKLKKCLEKTKQLLELPYDFLLGILAGSNTGAFEIALCLEENNSAFDIKRYKTAPLGLRASCGPTIEKLDLAYLTKWL